MVLQVIKVSTTDLLIVPLADEKANFQGGVAIRYAAEPSFSNDLPQIDSRYTKPMY